MHARIAYLGTVSVVSIACLAAAPPARALSPQSTGDEQTIATVNGRPITQRQMIQVLMEAHGLEIMQQLIVLELAREESRRLNLRVTDADVDREYRQAIDKIAPTVDEHGNELSPQDKEQALLMLLQQKGVTHAEFMLGMQRNAHLRKVVESEFTIDEATLREEFSRRYGEKVEIRHVQVDVGNVSRLHEVLNQVAKGVEFAEIARSLSENRETAPDGGLLPPFTFTDDAISPEIREAAFSMKPGEVSSAIKVARWWHVIRLERRVPPAGVRFEDVREEVQRGLRERAIPQRMNERMNQLFQKAQIHIVNPELRRKYKRVLEEGTVVEQPGVR